LNNFRQAIDRGRKLEDEWNAEARSLAKAYPEPAAGGASGRAASCPKLANGAPVFPPDKPMATREASGQGY